MRTKIHIPDFLEECGITEENDKKLFEEEKESLTQQLKDAFEEARKKIQENHEERKKYLQSPAAKGIENTVFYKFYPSWIPPPKEILVTPSKRTATPRKTRTRGRLTNVERTDEEIEKMRKMSFNIDPFMDVSIDRFRGKAHKVFPEKKHLISELVPLPELYKSNGKAESEPNKSTGFSFGISQPSKTAKQDKLVEPLKTDKTSQAAPVIGFSLDQVSRIIQKQKDTQWQCKCCESWNSNTSQSCSMCMVPKIEDKPEKAEPTKTTGFTFGISQLPETTSGFTFASPPPPITPKPTTGTVGFSLDQVMQISQKQKETQWQCKCCEAWNPNTSSSCSTCLVSKP